MTDFSAHVRGGSRRMRSRDCAVRSTDMASSVAQACAGVASDMCSKMAMSAQGRKRHYNKTGQPNRQQSNKE